MGFLLGVLIGGALGVMAGGLLARERRGRQVAAAIREGRISIHDASGATVRAEDFGVILDDEFRDA
ncbi:MAG: hypothetical protein KF886_07875 [Candidatus Hydrogenedentes bacterium]|nr:hypothetical protein [Candidatus Hydrogenedentota bacterium]